MPNFSHQRIRHQSFPLDCLLHVVRSGQFSRSHSVNLILDRIESPPRQDNEMSTLRVPAYNPEDRITHMVAYLELLINLRVAAAVEDGPLHDFAHKAFLILDVNSWTVFWAEAAVVVSHSFVRRVLVVVETCDAP